MVCSCPSILARYLRPALGFHQLRPAAIELAVVALAHAEITGPSVEALVETLMSQPHLGVDRKLPRHHTPTGLRTLLPVVHIVLLECAGWAEAPDTRQPYRFLDVGWRRLIGIDPRPHCGPFGTPRLPHPEGARGRPQHREIREHRADDRVDHTRSGAQTLLDLWTDLFLILQDLGYRRVGHIVRA